MSRSIRLVVLALSLVVAAGTYLTFYGSAKTVPPAPEDWPGLAYQSEDEWIVGQTVRAVIDLARFVESGSPAPLDHLKVSDVTVDPAFPGRFFVATGSEPVTVLVDTYVWDPNVYASLAKRVSAREARPAASDDVLTALLNPDAATLQSQNERISSALTADRQNAAHHEAAAFLLTTLALREASGFFYDPRLVLSRAAAHLAVARALRGAGVEASLTGQLADVMLQILAGRTGSAVSRMDVLAGGSVPDAAHAWMRALRRRATFDWREKPSDTAPLIVRLVYMRSLARILSVNASLEYLQSTKPEAIPDWGWRTLDFPLTVANGHIFVRMTYAQTHDEAEQILATGTGQYSRAAFTEALGTTPGISSVDRTVSGGLRVIDAGTWGAFYQRHLAHVTFKGSDFYRDVYGSREAAEAFEAIADRFVGDVPSWPIVQRLRARTPADYRATMPRAVARLREHPETVSYLTWHYLLQRVPEGSVRPAAPAVLRWYRTIFPTGTAFETRRLNYQTIIPEDFVVHADAMHAMAPWDPHVTLQWSIVRCVKRCTPEQDQANWALIADYHLASIQKFAYASADPVPGLRRVCEISADECHELANWFVSRDRFDEAARAYEHYMRVGRDRVDVSNRVEWLVRHYQRSGRSADARRVAERAADVGSGRGLRALAGYFDRAGNHARAEEIYRAILERYPDNGWDLLAFYLRRADATGRTPDDPEYVALLNRYFAGVLLKADPEEAAPPARGLRVTRTTPWVEQAGFKVGDIVTAIDGVQVWTKDQYSVLYDRSFDEPLRFTVWRANKYTTIEGDFRRYYYGIDVEPFAAAGVPR